MLLLLLTVHVSGLMLVLHEPTDKVISAGAGADAEADAEADADEDVRS